MKAKRIILIGAILVSGIVGTMVVTKDGRASKGAGVKAARKDSPQVKYYPRAQARIIPAPPLPPGKRIQDGWVNVLPTTKGATRDHHMALAKVLSDMDFVPPNRAMHFQALDTPEYRLDGWHAFVESAETTPEGTLVSLRVTPRVTCSYGMSTTVLGGVIERYLVANGRVQFVDLTVPPGGAFHGVITD